MSKEVSNSQPRRVGIEMWQFFFGIATAEAIIIVFLFGNFPTKEAFSTQLDLRKQIRDNELKPMVDDISDIKKDLKDVNLNITKIMVKLRIE